MITRADNRFDAFYLQPLLAVGNLPRSNRLHCKQDLMFLMRCMIPRVTAFYSELYDSADGGSDER